RPLPAETGLGDLGEQRPRHPDAHRDDVDDERHHQHRPGEQEAQALDHRAQAGAPEIPADRWQGRQAHRGGQPEAEQGGVEAGAVRPPPCPITTPASTGPTNVAVWVAVKVRVLAAGTSALVRRRGITALRVGEVSAKPTDWTTTSPMINSTLPTCSSAWASR